MHLYERFDSMLKQWNRAWYIVVILNQRNPEPVDDDVNGDDVPQSLYGKMASKLLKIIFQVQFIEWKYFDTKKKWTFRVANMADLTPRASNMDCTLMGWYCHELYLKALPNSNSKSLPLHSVWKCSVHGEHVHVTTGWPGVEGTKDSYLELFVI